MFLVAKNNFRVHLHHLKDPEPRRKEARDCHRLLCQILVKSEVSLVNFKMMKVASWFSSDNYSTENNVEHSCQMLWLGGSVIFWKTFVVGLKFLVKSEMNQSGYNCLPLTSVWL